MKDNPYTDTDLYHLGTHQPFEKPSRQNRERE